MSRWNIKNPALQILFVTVVSIAILITIDSLTGWLNENSGLAAWVQAIGAIVAIAASYMIARSGVEAADRLRSQDRTRFLKAAESTVLWAYSVVATLADKTFSGVTYAVFKTNYRPSDFEGALRALRHISLTELVDLDLVRDLLRLEAVLDDAAKRLAEVKPAASGGGVLAENLPDMAAMQVAASNPKESFRLRVLELTAGTANRVHEPSGKDRRA